ncbi:MAG: UDP-3-O-acyl-N-acetylglucosamine deacetylase [Rhodospirillaceae bacterium]
MSQHEGNDVGLYQRTLKRPIHCAGVGLHSGAQVSLRINPAEVDAGISFVRTDPRGGGAVIPARWDHVVDTRLCTVIGNGRGINVGTVEHVMAALAGVGIDNAVIEIDGPEVPIMDGSSAPFVFLIECVGIKEQKARRKVLRLRRQIAVGDAGRRATLSPSAGSSFSFEIAFDSKVMTHRVGSLELVEGAFKEEVSRARTFGFLHEVEELRRNGLARGGSLDNAVVISGDAVINEGGLRYEDEFVRHKILDSVGDLYLAGHRIVGHFHGWRSGHHLNNQLLKAMFADAAAFELVEITQGNAAEEEWTAQPRRAAIA